MLRRLRLILLWLLLAASVLTALLWSLSITDGSIALTDEKERLNITGFWGSKFFSLRPYSPIPGFPGHVQYLPGRFLVLIQWTAWEGQDYVSISFRPRVQSVPASKLYGQIGMFRAFQDSIAAEDGWPAAADYTIDFPVWFLFLTLAAWPSLAFARGPLRRWHRRRRGRCVKCAYDLTGNTSGVCPECGTVIE